MALKQARTWTCDICDKTAVVSAGTPDQWRCNVEVVCQWRKASADFCEECWYRCFPTPPNETYAKNVEHGEFRRPWWRKFFGGKCD